MPFSEAKASISYTLIFPPESSKSLHETLQRGSLGKGHVMDEGQPVNSHWVWYKPWMMKQKNPRLLSSFVDAIDIIRGSRQLHGGYLPKKLWPNLFVGPRSGLLRMHLEVTKEWSSTSYCNDRSYREDHPTSVEMEWHQYLPWSASLTMQATSWCWIVVLKIAKPQLAEGSTIEQCQSCLPLCLYEVF